MNHQSESVLAHEFSKCHPRRNKINDLLLRRAFPEQLAFCILPSLQINDRRVVSKRVANGSTISCKYASVFNHTSHHRSDHPFVSEHRFGIAPQITSAAAAAGLKPRSFLGSNVCNFELPKMAEIHKHSSPDTRRHSADDLLRQDYHNACAINSARHEIMICIDRFQA